jgi:uncharacterized membrane protein YhaH (DUF805 family)
VGNQLDFNTILQRLNPFAATGGDVLWGIWIYIIMALVFITLMLQDETKQKEIHLNITILLSIVLLCCLVDKVAVGTGRRLYPLDRKQIEVFFLRVPMFVFPIVIAGMTRTGKSRGWAIVAGILGGIYLFARWLTEQSN